MFSMHDGMQKLDCLLTNLDGLKNWDVSNGIDFMNMFSGCSSFQNVDGLINWNVSKVKSLGLRFKEECFVVENAPLGVRAGKAAGLFTIAVNTGPLPDSELLAEGADCVLPNMKVLVEFLQKTIKNQ
jgi:surface protein